MYFLPFTSVPVQHCNDINARPICRNGTVVLVLYKFDVKHSFYKHDIYKSRCLLTKEPKSHNLPSHGLMIALKTAGLSGKLISDVSLAHSMPFKLMKAALLKSSQ